MRVRVPRRTARLNPADSYTGPGMGRGASAFATESLVGAGRVCALAATNGVTPNTAATSNVGDFRTQTSWELGIAASSILAARGLEGLRLSNDDFPLHLPTERYLPDAVRAIPHGPAVYLQQSRLKGRVP